jgi:NhaP-type Na+/H+ or K+/H+ antiporter
VEEEMQEVPCESKAGICGMLKMNFWNVVTLEAGVYVLMVLAVYVTLVFVWELNYFIPFDGGFAIVCLWCGAFVGGQLLSIIGMPPLLGMLLAGMALKNCGDPVRGLPDSWAAAIRAFGLMNILMRGGLEMDVGAVRRIGMAVVRLTALPGITEALCVAGLAMATFQMKFFLALAFGFILAAVSPAVVVGGMFDLQSRGYGVGKGIPSLVVAAASFDDVVAISGFSMFIGLASGTGDVLWEALHGPINIVAGVLFGLLGAGVMSLTKIWNTPQKRSFMFLVIGTGLTFAAKKAHFAGAGALACLVMAALCNQFWSRGVGGRLSMGPDDHAAHEVERDLCTVWRVGAEPLLFCVIGSALDFRQIDPGTIPKAIGLVCGAVIVRCVIAFFSTCGAGLTVKERIFIALAWMPKATVQAALGPVPLDMLRNGFPRSDDPALYDKQEQQGVDILTTAVFSILITAPVGLLVIQWLGPAWLEQEVDSNGDDNAVSNLGEGKLDCVDELQDPVD